MTLVAIKAWLADRADRQLGQRFGLNAASYAYAQVATVAAQLLVVPFFLRYWGVAGYGDWLVLSGIPVALTLLDVGVTQASASKATVLAAKGDWMGVQRAVQTGTMFTLAVAMTACVVFLGVSVNVDWVDLLGIQTIDSEQTQRVMCALVVYVLMSFAGGPLDSWYRVIDRTALGAFLLANRRMVDVAVSIAVLTMGGSVVTMACALAAGQVIAALALALCAKLIQPHSVMGISQASRAEFLTIWKPAIGSAGIPFGQVIAIQGGLQLLNHVSGPGAVVTFSMGRTLMRLVVQGGAVINSALKPEISRLVGKGEIERARKFAANTSIIALVVAALGYGVLLLVGPDLVAWWGAGKVALSRTELALVGAHTILNVAWFVPSALVSAINRHSRLALVYVAASATALGCWACLSGYIDGYFGASLLLAIPEACVLFYVLRLAPIQMTFSEGAASHA